MTESNGHHQGRAVAPLPTFTFKDTGITVSIRKVSPLLGMEVRKAFPAPKPPRNPPDSEAFKLGEEYNEADPDYEREMEAYGQVIEEKVSRLYIKRGVECEVDTAAVAELRLQMGDMGIDLDPDDKLVYLKYICVGSTEDYQELIEVITRRSQPTEAAIAEAIDTFQSDVPG